MPSAIPNHSPDTEGEWANQEPIQLLHGTTKDAWEKIQGEGLKQGPHALSFSPLDDSTESGKIPGIPKPDILIYIDWEKARKDGMKFHQRAEQTIEMEGAILGSQYITKVVDSAKGITLLDNQADRRQMMMSMDQFRNMKLYSDSKIKHILHKAVDITYMKGNALCVQDFASLDQLHYLGNEGIDEWLTFYKDELGKGATVLDIGSGAGGPARYMATHPKHDLKVTGIEYMDDFVRVAWVINSLLRIPKEKCSIECADFTKVHLNTKNWAHSFDGVTSQLVYLHIADKPKLFQQMARSMKPGGCFVIEDFFLKGKEFSEVEKKLLQGSVSVPDAQLNTEQEYREYLEKNHFIVDKWVEMTDAWTEFVWARCESFHGDEKVLEEEYGRKYVDELGEFYDAITQLFHHNPHGKSWDAIAPGVCKSIKWNKEGWKDKPQNLGGVRIFGRRDDTVLSRQNSAEITE